jgi:hypothetical protein
MLSKNASHFYHLQPNCSKRDWFFVRFENLPTEPAARQLVKEKLKASPSDKGGMAEIARGVDLRRKLTHFAA